MEKVDLVLILFIIFSLSCFGCNNPKDKSFKSNEIKKELTLEEKLSGIYALDGGKKYICDLLNVKKEPEGGYFFILKIDTSNNRASGRFLYNEKLFEMKLEKMGELHYNLIYENNKLAIYLSYEDTPPYGYYCTLQLNKIRKNSGDRDGDRSRDYQTIEEALRACKEYEKFTKEINEYK